MSQRDSGYARVERDLYQTPPWATEALIPHIPDRIQSVWEPACGDGKMVRALSPRLAVTASDIVTGIDFLEQKDNSADAVITNPPYSHASDFIEHAQRAASVGVPLKKGDWR